MFLAVLPAFLVSSSVFRFALSKIDDKLSPPKKGSALVQLNRKFAEQKAM